MSDSRYKANIGKGKWLKGNGFTSDENEADIFESKTEPMQRINQMKKDGKLSKDTNINMKELKESTNDGSIGQIKGNNVSLYGTNYVLDPQRMPTQLKGVMQYAIPAVDVVTKKRVSDEKELLNDIKAGKTISLYDKNNCHIAESCLFNEILKEEEKN